LAIHVGASLGAVAGGRDPQKENQRQDTDTRAAAAAASQTAGAFAASATLRHLAAKVGPRVSLRSVYVRGVAGESRIWRLRDVSAAVKQLLRRAVVQAGRFGDLVEVRLLAEHADTLEAVVALSPDACVLTLVSGVGPLSIFLLGAHLPRWLSEERERDTVRDCHVARCQEQLASVDKRVGIPLAHTATMGAALMRELAPFAQELVFILPTASFDAIRIN